MRHAILVLERCLTDALETMALSAEGGDHHQSAAASAIAEDCQQALIVLKEVVRQGLRIPKMSEEPIIRKPPN